MTEQASQVEIFRKELAKRFVQKINSAFESGESEKLQETMDLLGKYLVESSGVEVPSKSFSELELVVAGIDNFTKRDIEANPGYLFMGGSEGARIYFRDSLRGGIEMHYGKPSEASYPKSGKFYEKFFELFGSEDVLIAHDGTNVEVAHPLLAQPDEILVGLDKLFPASELGEFLDNYEEAKKIANYLIQLRKAYSRIDLERLVVDTVLRKFSGNGFNPDQLLESFKSGSLRNDYSQLFDFTDFVEGAFEIAHGEIVEPNLFEQTNALLLEKCGPYHDIDHLPEIKGAESLAGKRIFMIDDLDVVLSKFVPPLMVTTGGTAEFIHHADQNIDEIVDLIMDLQPEIILLDNKLSAGTMGPEVADQLIKRGYTGKIIGFSDRMQPPKGFAENGVTAYVRKDTNNSIYSIQSVAKLLSENKINILS